MVLPPLRTDDNLQHTDDEKWVRVWAKVENQKSTKTQFVFLNTLYGKNTAKIFFFCSKRKKYTAMAAVLRRSSAACGSRAACCSRTRAQLLGLQSFIKAKIILRREETSVNQRLPSTVPTRSALSRLTSPRLSNHWHFFLKKEYLLRAPQSPDFFHVTKINNWGGGGSVT